MKKSIVTISLLLTAFLPGKACGPYTPTHNFYMMSSATRGRGACSMTKWTTSGKPTRDGNPSNIPIISATTRRCCWPQPDKKVTGR